MDLRGTKNLVQRTRGYVNAVYSLNTLPANRQGEANKIIKYNYLYRMNIASGEELTKIFPTIVNDFNNRPHVSLHGLTPNEACAGVSMDIEKLKLHKQRAAEERKLYNTNNRCEQCRS